MSVPQPLAALLEQMSDQQVQQVVQFARLLASQDDDSEWREFGRSQFAEAFGPDEPVYTEADLKPELKD